ncbi:MAG: twin-arginine translocation signal domain-containing protein, partial [Planctomycetes bacterium]|nr:twin-arginine translocation signal domain-containing protein [Planctomycetota bacterium]
MRNDQINRRRFVRDSTLAAAGMAVGLNAAEAAKGTRNYSESMEYRPLGATGLMLSAISLGGHWKKVPYQYGTEAFAKNRRDVVSACIDCGINYVDACTEG